MAWILKHMSIGLHTPGQIEDLKDTFKWEM